MPAAVVAKNFQGAYNQITGRHPPAPAKNHNKIASCSDLGMELVGWVGHFGTSISEVYTLLSDINPQNSDLNFVCFSDLTCFY